MTDIELNTIIESQDTMTLPELKREWVDRAFARRLGRMTAKQIELVHILEPHWLVQKFVNELLGRYEIAGLVTDIQAFEVWQFIHDKRAAQFDLNGATATA